jgi:hypothetical protein
MNILQEALKISAHQGPGHRPQGQERTADDPQRVKEAKPEELSSSDKREIIELVRRYKQSWFLRRRMIIKRVLKAYEFFKGNQFISFDPESFQWFDALEATFAGQQADNEDLNLYQFATNFYQMLGFAFVAALSAQLPKTRFLPENAEREEDIATARASSRVQEIIERQNRVKSLHKQGLLFLWMSGCYFRHTRYVVDSDRAGTHKEPVLEVKSHVLMPARYLCGACGATTPAHKAASISGNCCGGCRAPLGDHQFYPEEQADIPVIAKTRDVPNGMVTMNLYSPLHVDAAPYAKNLRETPILNVDEEVDIASIRASYPEQWDGLKSSLGPMLSEAQNERQARSIIYSEAGGHSNYLQDLMPTLSRTWVQPWAFNAIENKETAMKLKKLFPTGCLLVNVGDTFLEAREARLTDEWSWAGTVQETFGLYPPAVGDAAIPVQERINDVANITHEYMDRIAAGMLLYNSNLIDGEALNGKPFLPGVFNGVKMKQTASAMGNRLEDAIVQIKAEIDNNMYGYHEKLVFTMQMISGTPPQIFGGSGDPHIETMGGQQQQLTTALGKLSLFWDNVRDEHADAAEIGVGCAQKNMTDDWTNSVTDESGQYRNDYVRLDEMRGSVHAYPETDQNFPMSFAEVRAFWEKLMEFGAGGKNPYLNAMLDDPTNQEQIANWTGVPGLVVPGRDMRNKVLRTIDLLMKQKPIRKPAAAPPLGMMPPGGPLPGGGSPGGTPMPGGTGMLPPGGPPISAAAPEPEDEYLPSIEPDKDLDDMDVIQKTIRHWAQKNFDVREMNPEGFRNVIAFYKMAVKYGKEQAAKAAMEQKQLAAN